MIFTIFKQKKKILSESVISELTVPLIRQKMSIADGFKTEREALEFGNNSCGAACLKMILEAFDIKNVPSVKELTRTAIEKGFYKEPQGWIHQGLVDFAQLFGMHAKTLMIKNPESMLGELKKNKLIIASVSSAFNSKRRGGHLIVIKGMAIKDGVLENIYFNDPSAWGQAHSEIDGTTFLNCWPGNIIIIGES